MAKTAVYGNYGRLLRMDKKGDAYFYMTATKTKLPLVSEMNAPCPDMEALSFFYCYGKVAEYHLGYPLILYGQWEKRPGGRWVLAVSDYEEDVKTGKALEDFLIRECPGVGSATAGKINKIGEKLWELAEKENGADILQKETGIQPGLCRMMLSALKKNRGKYNLYQYLRCYGITDIKTDTLLERYGTEALKVIQCNPYQSLNSLVPFRIMDEIAFESGGSHLDGERIKGLIFYAMDLLTKNGSTGTNIFILYDKVEELSAKSIFHREIPRSLISIILNDMKGLHIEKEENQIYFREIWKREWDIARGIKRLEKHRVPLRFIPVTTEIEKELGITYAEKQKEAFGILKTTGVKVLTGGPGTGKTTLMNGIIRQYQKMYPEHRIALCAPTGMAAEHMAEMTGKPASTIHRLLDYRPFSDDEASFKTAEDPIDAEMVIVDEASMGDTKLMGMLFDAVKPGTLLLLCGDVDQLDCVGYGSVLHDIIRSGKVPVYALDTLFRQKEGGHIIQNAARIRQKNPKLATGEDFEIWRFGGKREFAEIFGEIWRKYGKDPFQAQVLSTVKNGSYGIRALNTYIQKQRVYEKGREIHRNGYVFHKGDKVMTMVNNYEAGYFNGDIGRIIEITDMGSVTLQIGKKSIRMKHVWLEDIVPAYAVTVHKSQGSEFETVIIILPKTPDIILDKSLIYTAVTRAKSKVIILSEGNALEYGIRRDKRQDRKTGLIQKVNYSDL